MQGGQGDGCVGVFDFCGEKLCILSVLLRIKARTSAAGGVGGCLCNRHRCVCLIAVMTVVHESDGSCCDRRGLLLEASQAEDRRLNGEGVGDAEGRGRSAGGMLQAAVELKTLVEKAEGDASSGAAARVLPLAQQILRQLHALDRRSQMSLTAPQVTEVLSIAWRAVAAGSGDSLREGMAEECVALLSQLQSAWRLS